MRKIKRLLAIVLCMALLITSSSVYAFAEGEGNVDGGGGSMGGGTKDNIWHEGEEGVRVTVVRISDNMPVSKSVDLTNKNESNVEYYFAQMSKLSYQNGASLTVKSSQIKYTYKNPSKALPKIISGGGNGNIAAIKSYFTDRQVLKSIARIIGTTYEKLIDGKYKLLLEPVGYFTFNGAKWAMTATEAAKYDQKLSGGLRSKMVSFSHQNLPLSMFLEHSDMGYPAYSGSQSKPQSDATIISSLGLGIVKFKDEPEEDKTPDDAAYRTDTDVITSVTLTSSSEIDPDHAGKVTFNINGKSYTVTDIAMPKDESELIWVKWHTPKTPQTVTINVSATKGSLSTHKITAKIESITEKTPPDPQGTDRNDSFTTPSVPNKTACVSNTWGIWDAYWEENWVWHEHMVWESNDYSEAGGTWEDEGEWVDKGSWAYNYKNYTATLRANMSLLPDDKVPTAKGKQMRSGYGVKINVTSNIKTSAPSSNFVNAQTAATYFPEFSYNTYWRVLDLQSVGTFAFKNNIYSTYNRRVHFTPVWYPDGTYTAYTYLQDAWTPAGQLQLNLSDYVTIYGSVYDDWHVGPQLTK